MRGSKPKNTGATMVRAIDEYRGAPESGNKAATDKTPNDARLTTMPQCLMHWWTPILIAGFLFVGTTLCAFWWEWHFHWPSVQAMQLCATAAGVGFGLAAWQQRSHDNAAQAQQAHATEEREEYWKRREHAYQLLESDNPGQRLGAITLLAELADRAEHNQHIPTGEKHQLQDHIISILCTQARREGLNGPSQTSRREHADLQRAIIQTILERIQNPREASPDDPEPERADWSNKRINLKDITFLSEIRISDLSTNAILDLDGSTFDESFTIHNSTINRIHWRKATFKKILVEGGDDNKTIIGTSRLPETISDGTFKNVMFTSADCFFSIHYAPPGAEDTVIRFHHCRLQSGAFTPADENTHEAISLDIRYLLPDENDASSANTSRPAGASAITVSHCQISSLNVSLKPSKSEITIEENIIEGTTSIQYSNPRNEPHTAWNEVCISVVRNEVRERPYEEVVVIRSDGKIHQRARANFHNNTLTGADHDGEHHWLTNDNISEIKQR